MKYSLIVMSMCMLCLAGCADITPSGGSSPLSGQQQSGDEQVCTMIYSPVCAQKQTECETEACKLNRQTYANMCEVEKADATFLYEGECRKPTLADRLATRVRVTSPLSGSRIHSPVMIVGEAPGNWFFEATAPVSVVNRDGLIIGEGYITALSDRMTEAQVPFSGSIEYTIPAGTPYERGEIILQRSNASGLPEHDAAISVPIVIQ